MIEFHDLVTKVRSELADHASLFSKTFIGDGRELTFPLGFKPVDAMSIQVTIDGSIVTQPTYFVLEDKNGVIYFVNPPAQGSVIKVLGNAYRYFTDGEIENYINTSITQHTYNRTDGFGRKVTLRTLDHVEEYPIVILSVIEALWALATDSAFDINIMAPDGIMIPRDQRYSQLTNIIQQRWEQYRTICTQLNVGLWKIEMGNLRRVSRTTNRLVPLYVAQEADDPSMPERLYIPENVTGRTLPVAKVPIYDLNLGVQGDSFTIILDFGRDVTGLSFQAQVRSYPTSPTLFADFAITVLQNNPARIQLSLTRYQTDMLPLRSFWDLRATSSDPNYEETFVRGQVFTQPQVTLDTL